MKIHDHGGGGPRGLPGVSRNGAKEAHAATPAEPASPTAEPAGALPAIQLPAGATRADLDSPARMAELMHAAVAQIVERMPISQGLTPAQRQRLETHLANDPAMQALLTRYLEGTLR